MPRSCSDSFYLQLIYEYLLHMGLENTAASLREESNTCNYPPPEEVSGVRRRDITNLLRHFDSEDETGFLKILYTSIPPPIRNSYEGKKMIADLLVYFAALSLLKDGYDQKIPWMKPLVHAPPNLFQNYELSSSTTNMSRIPGTPGSHSHTSTNVETLERLELCKCCGQKICICEKDPAETASKAKSVGESSRPKQVAYSCMENLNDYLESECSNLRDDPYFMPYFSLPFTMSPQTHYQYKHIFQGSWPKGLRRRFWDFLVHHRQAAGLPSLVRLLPSCEVLIVKLRP